MLVHWLTLFRKQTAANNNTSFILHIAREDTVYPLSYPYLYFYTLLFLIIPFPISCICGKISTFYLLTFSFFLTRETKKQSQHTLRTPYTFFCHSSVITHTLSSLSKSKKREEVQKYKWFHQLLNLESWTNKVESISH